MERVHKLFIKELEDLYDSEKQILKAMPKMIKAAHATNLKSALENHRQQTELQKLRLENIFDLMQTKPKALPCKGMKGILAEGSSMLKGKKNALRDAVLIAAAQKVEHYEIASYGTAIALADLMQQTVAGALLRQTLSEEESADKELAAIADLEVNLAAMAA
jgi:ferritin-like metal-binding protein YciE